MNYTGTIETIMAEQSITEKFKKREFVLCDGHEQYPQFVLFEMTNDRCSLLDNFKEGDKVEIDFQLKGRKWKNPQGEIKYFNTLNAYKIFHVKSEGAKPEPTRPAPSKKPADKSTPKKQETEFIPTPDNDLPF